MIRQGLKSDKKAILKLTESTGIFKPSEITALREVLDDYYETNFEDGHRLAVYGAEPLGFAYWAPVHMTDGTWYLWWIAVAKDAQGGGLGMKLLKHVEDEVRAAKGRLLCIETSGTDQYKLTRKFYMKNGYRRKAAVIKDFYADGDDLVVYHKRLKGG